MLMAAIGDIRGNLPPLEAVLAALSERKIQTVVHTGNTVVGHDFGGSILTRLDAFGAVSVQGAEDRQAARFYKKRTSISKRLDAQQVEDLARAQDTLSSVQIERIAALPPRRLLKVDGVRVLLCYGSPGSQRDVLAADSPIAKFERQREIEVVDIIVCGGAPSFFRRRVGGTLFVGPGPLVCKEGVAAYTLLSTETEPWEVSRQQVAYLA